MNEADLLTALRRADKLLGWMTQYIGQMAPGDYADCYRDLNEHYIFMASLPKQDSIEEPTMTRTERQSFIAYLRQCTDRQVEGVYRKEKDAGREEYADLAESEARARNITLD